jgi:hypothetical protein
MIKKKSKKQKLGKKIMKSYELIIIVPWVYSMHQGSDLLYKIFYKTNRHFIYHSNNKNTEL